MSEKQIEINAPGLPDKKSAQKTLKEQSSNLRLSDQQARSLLDPVDVVRDPLHGDIHLTKLERYIVDTPEFQRLRGINQLAMTYIAYPGALHNRFIHSLGTLHVCSEMIETCNNNAETYSRLAPVAPEKHPRPVAISDYGKLLARLCALCHDLAHVSFGHTFEKEAQLFEKDEWQDPEREELLLGKNSGIRRCMYKIFEDARLPKEAADSLLEDIRNVLKTKRANVESLPYPFVHDLVGNTICADLIDYVKRDMYFCGLTETFGERFLNYLAVIPVAKRKDADIWDPIVGTDKLAFVTRKSEQGRVEACRVVLMNYRYNERGAAISKHDVFEEAIDLVRRRLFVAEKLYFHRTKISASAMLAAAARATNLKAKDIWNLCDAEVLRKLENDANARARLLAQKIIARRLFKPIYCASYHPEDGTHASDLIWDAYKKFKDPKKREELAARLEHLIGLKRGAESATATVVLSCPNRDMNLKAFEMLVLPSPNSEIKTLEKTDVPITQDEIKVIKNTHLHLWRLEVFIDTDVVPLNPNDPFVRKLAGAITHEIGPNNEVREFKNVVDIDLVELENEMQISSYFRQLGVENEIKHVDQVELIDSGAHRDLFTGNKDADLSRIREFLRSKGYKVKE